MTKSLVTSALAAVSMACLAPLASAQSAGAYADTWLTRDDGSMIEEMSGVVCPTSVDDFTRVETTAYSEGGFCAYEADTEATDFTVQFYAAGPHDTEEELVRTLAHFEDNGAIASMTYSVGCEANMASVAAGGSSIASLTASFRDYQVEDDLRCLVLEADDSSVWVISLQRAGDYFISTVSAAPNGDQSEIAHMVDASSHFHAAQFAGPAV